MLGICCTGGADVTAEECFIRRRGHGSIDGGVGGSWGDTIHGPNERAAGPCATFRGGAARRRGAAAG